MSLILSCMPMHSFPQIVDDRRSAPVNDSHASAPSSSSAKGGGGGGDSFVGTLEDAVLRNANQVGRSIFWRLEKRKVGLP